MGITITPELIQRAKLCGACEVPLEGTPIHGLTQRQLIWCENVNLLDPREKAGLCGHKDIPLSLLASSGSGSGYGYGSGSGYGDGDG